MLKSLKTFIAGSVGRTKRQDRLEASGCRLAIAALLVRVASVNEEWSDAERNALSAVLEERFGLDSLAAGKLIDEAIEVNRDAVDLYHFTCRVNRYVDDEGRCRIVRMMWEIVYAEVRVSPFAQNIVWRTADLLGVSSRRRVEIRRDVAAEKTAAASVESVPTRCGVDADAYDLGLRLTPARALP